MPKPKKAPQTPKSAKKPTKKPKEKKKNRPTTTLFLVNSVDGRITSHDSDTLDPNKSWKKDPKIQAITQPFFDFARGQFHTITYGESLAAIGVNQRTSLGNRSDINLIILDHQSHLTTQGIHYLADNFKKIYLGCLSSHPITKAKSNPSNIKLIVQKGSFSLKDFLVDLKKNHKIKQVSIQSNAKLNARWLSDGLIDYLSVIISPLLVGRHGTPNLIDQDLLNVKPLVLTDMKAFGLDFVNLRYDVVNQ